MDTVSLIMTILVVCVCAIAAVIGIKQFSTKQNGNRQRLPKDTLTDFFIDDSEKED